MSDSEKVVKNDDGSFTVTLSFPLKGSKGEIAVIRLRGEPTVADLEAMDKAKGDVEKSRLLIADLSGISPAILATMRIPDYISVMEAVGKILGNE